MADNAVDFKNLLVIDDDPSLGKTLSSVLQKAGYRVDWVSSGAEGIAFVEKRSPDEPLGAVMIDVRLPDMNGLDVLRCLKKVNPDIGAIMMTGFTDVETAVGALNEGAFAYVQKPYNLVEVKAIIQRSIEKQVLIRENWVLLKKMVELNAELEQRVQQRTSDLEEANAKLESTVQKLREADTAKSDFISMVSHELRTPLTAIIGFAQTLINHMEKLPKETVQHYLKIVLTHGVMLSKLVESLLDISRIQQKGMSLALEPLDLRGLAESAVESLKVLKPSIRFEISFEEGLGDVVSDRERVQQIFINLVGNAIKYTPDGGTVRVAARADGDEVVVSVVDSGPGIPEDVQQKIFEPFFRAKDAINMKTPGTGLGLTITKAIVEALGGRIWVESRPGLGSSFSFVLPRAKEPVPEAR